MQKIYNTLTHEKQNLIPVSPGKIRMYVCGVTVYDYCHVGHARVLVNFDIVQRWLKTRGFLVNYVRNITDIDDKIINLSLETGDQPQNITEFYTSAMHADEKALGIESPNKEPKATKYVKEMLSIIARLNEAGLAYQDSNGDVNFSVRNFSSYGKLSRKTLDDLYPKKNLVSIDLSRKRDHLDFVLWKINRKENILPEMQWKSRYGLGRPGWHIECSAMSEALLGLPLDIHGGGLDLKFPHHENEIAQSESAFNCNLANIWMHCGPLMIKGQKMSKSLGNFRTIREVVGFGDISGATYKANPREAEALRFFILRKHYRSILNFSVEGLVDAQNVLDKLYQTLWKINPIDTPVDWSNTISQSFEMAMNDDFNTPKAISTLFKLASQANRNNCHVSAGQLKSLSNFLGFLQQDPSNYFRIRSRYTRTNLKDSSTFFSKNQISDENIEKIILSRETAKRLKNYQEADRIRNFLHELGIELQDRKDGKTLWKFFH